MRARRFQDLLVLLALTFLDLICFPAFWVWSHEYLMCCISQEYSASTERDCLKVGDWRVAALVQGFISHLFSKTQISIDYMVQKSLYSTRRFVVALGQVMQYILRWVHFKYTQIEISFYICIFIIQNPESSSF